MRLTDGFNPDPSPNPPPDPDPDPTPTPAHRLAGLAAAEGVDVRQRLAAVALRFQHVQQLLPALAGDNRHVGLNKDTQQEL